MRRSLVIAFGLCGLAACGGDDPTGTSGLSGTFDLTAIDGVGPPRIEWINMAGDTLFTTGGEMRILSRGRASMVVRRQWHSHATGPVPEEPDTAIVSYRLEGSRIFLDYPVSVPYGPYTDTGTVGEDIITVRTKLHGFQLGTVFVRDYRYARR